MTGTLRPGLNTATLYQLRRVGNNPPFGGVPRSGFPKPARPRVMRRQLYGSCAFPADNLVAGESQDRLASFTYQTMAAHASKAEPGLPLSPSAGMRFASGLAGTLAAGLGLVWAVSAVAATNALDLGEGLVIRSWRTGAGLPQNTVNAIAQTPDGYLWVGTRDGLARFDGVRFTVFGLPDGLQSVEIQTLYVDRMGTLWIGTSGGGLSRWAEGRIESVSLPHQIVGGDNVTALSEDADGRLWIGTLAGLDVWHDGGFVDMPELARVERVGIRALRRDRSGGMWIATLSNGLYEFRNHRLAENRGPCRLRSSARPPRQAHPSRSALRSIRQAAGSDR